MNQFTTFVILAATKLNSNDVGVNKVNANAVLNGVLNTVYFVAAVVAVISIILGGILYATANGDPSKVTRARQSIQYSVIGLVVVMFAFVITGFVIGSF